MLTVQIRINHTIKMYIILQLSNVVLTKILSRVFHGSATPPVFKEIDLCGLWFSSRAYDR